MFLKRSLITFLAMDHKKSCLFSLFKHTYITNKSGSIDMLIWQDRKTFKLLFLSFIIISCKHGVSWNSIKLSIFITLQENLVFKVQVTYLVILSNSQEMALVVKRDTAEITISLSPYLRRYQLLGNNEKLYSLFGNKVDNKK